MQESQHYKAPWIDIERKIDIKKQNERKNLFTLRWTRTSYEI